MLRLDQDYASLIFDVTGQLDYLLGGAGSSSEASLFFRKLVINNWVRSGQEQLFQDLASVAKQ